MDFFKHKMTIITFFCHSWAARNYCYIASNFIIFTIKNFVGSWSKNCPVTFFKVYHFIGQLC